MRHQRMPDTLQRQFHRTGNVRRLIASRRHRRNSHCGLVLLYPFAGRARRYRRAVSSDGILRYRLVRSLRLFIALSVQAVWHSQRLEIPTSENGDR